MSDEMLRAYKAARMMEPVALVDYFVQVKTYKDKQYRKVSYRESIPPHQVLDIGAIAVQTVSARTNAGNLDLQDDEFGQWRWFPMDNAMVRLFNPAGVSKHQLKFVQIGVEKSIIYRDPTLLSTEFFSWQDERPAFEGMNFSDYALNACRIIVFGYRYKTEVINADDHVIIEGIQRGQDAGRQPVRAANGILRAGASYALPLGSGEYPRVIRTLDALRMKLIPVTPVECAGQP